MQRGTIDIGLNKNPYVIQTFQVTSWAVRHVRNLAVPGAAGGPVSGLKPELHDERMNFGIGSLFVRHSGRTSITGNAVETPCTRLSKRPSEKNLVGYSFVVRSVPSTAAISRRILRFV